ncbi:L,D-transpeptidase family protein [Arhodomonas sp. AD133]|uniref:L,D-transpeptidase family protein n=1 Tax=Arhodomonas sp. AD133 TaxID=3415009 RepID=UPI003EB911C1
MRIVRGLVAMMLLAFALPIAAANPWVLIDTESDTAQVRNGDNVIETLENLSFGRGGISDLHLFGDETTPRGEYRITRIDRSSRFHVFVELDYPTLSHLDLAHRRGVVDDERYQALLDRSIERGRVPQNTRLGGYIGLHGLGKADTDIHERLHWTEGCVAMTDAQIERLLRHIRLGSRVVIR